MIALNQIVIYYYKGLTMRIVRILIILFSLVLTSCSFHDNIELTEKYFKVYENGEYLEIEELLSDSLTIIDGDYSKTYTTSEFYEFFQWDSVFKPKIKISELREKNNDIYITVTTYSERLEFLRHNPLITNQKLTFDNGKICTIEIMDYENFDLYQWSSRRDTLVKWIETYQPELSGFNFDMTKNGAENYLKSIELYEDKE